MDALTAYVQAQMGKPFAWGRRDCITFAGQALQASVGINPFDYWFGKYDDITGAIRTFAEFKRSEGCSASDWISARYDRVLTLYPKHGMLVARRTKTGPLNEAFGVVVNGACAFVSQEVGVVLIGTDVEDKYWSVV